MNMCYLNLGVITHEPQLTWTIAAREIVLKMLHFACEIMLCYIERVAQYRLFGIRIYNLVNYYLSRM